MIFKFSSGGERLSGLRSDPGRDKVALGLASGVALGGLALRLRAVPPALGDLDGVNFARALIAFDPTQQAPHFPGYPVYVAAARTAHAAGVSEPFALTAASIVLWPLAALLLAAGVRAHAGRFAGLVAVLIASLAPIAVLAGAWPGSDGLGATLWTAALGLFGLLTRPQASRGKAELASTSERSAGLRTRGAGATVELATERRALPDVGLAAALGAVLGALLGVRLSWWPLVAVVLFTGFGGDRSKRRLIASAAGLAGGVLAWLIPLVLIVGPARLLELALGFTEGHFLRWGGTALGGEADLGARVVKLAAAIGDGALGVSALGGGAPAVAIWAGAALGAALIARVLFARGSLRRPANLDRRSVVRGLASHLGAASIAIAALYTAWVLIAQNVDKPRHVLPLVPLIAIALGSALATVVRRRELRALSLGTLALALAATTLPRAIEQGSAPPPAAQLVEWVGASRDPARLQIFTGEEAALFQHMLPMYRVARAASGELLEREATRLSRSGVEVWITSAAPGMSALPGLVPLADFASREPLRGPGARLTLYRLGGAPALATLRGPR